MACPVSPIQQYFQDKNVFITGATGFLGKVLVEKLLRSCPGIGKIYLLVRPKRGVSARERVNILLASEVFSRMKSEVLNYEEHIVLIEGDMLELDLGISADNRVSLINTVHVVFHLAATIRFNEPLRHAILLNVAGVQKIVELCGMMKSLEVLVHVSTAYANCDKNYIAEIVYSPPVHPYQLLEASEWMKDDVLNILTPTFLNQLPNTYTYTKAAAEYLLVNEARAKNINIAIFRPSVVNSSWREPFPGWVDNFNGPTGICASLGKGLLRSMVGNVDAVADVIPVDVCVNMMIAVAWYTATSNAAKRQLVYHCTSGNIKKPCTWGLIETVSVETYNTKTPLEKAIFYPRRGLTTNRFVCVIKQYLGQLLPAYVLDMYLRLVGKKAMFMKLQNKISSAVYMLEFFTSRQWSFTDENKKMIMSKMSQHDIEVFNFELKDIDWNQYLFDFCVGIKKYLLKEDMSRQEECRKHMLKVHRMERIGVVLTFLIFIKLLFICSTSARKTALVVFNTFFQFLGWFLRKNYQHQNHKKSICSS